MSVYFYFNFFFFFPETQRDFSNDVPQIQKAVWTSAASTSTSNAGPDILP